MPPGRPGGTRGTAFVHLYRAGLVKRAKHADHAETAKGKKAGQL